MSKQPVVCLLGPTATGKTEIAISLVKRFPFEIVSVDSALVYRGMDIGTAKPDVETLRRVPHRLVDIRDPEDGYSAGDFVRDARTAIAEIEASGRIALLAGGTMLYFRALIEGMADLPQASADVRRSIDEDAVRVGWPAMHDRLREVDPVAADRIEPRDKQRIQRALEVYATSGRPLTDLQRDHAASLPRNRFITIGLNVAERQKLHARIERRLEHMVALGFVEEMRTLMARPLLDRDSPAMRAVGYRQYWSLLAGDYDADEAFRRALYATRQLAKRQVTWLRKLRPDFCVDPLEVPATATISAFVARELARKLT
jgi:tRNA dimethylallyltransferase